MMFLSAWIAALVFCMVSEVASISITDCPAEFQTDEKSLKIFENSCFFFELSKRRHAGEAASDCKHKGRGKLAMPKTKDLQDFLVAQLKDTYSFGGKVWIGLTDVHKEGEYDWVDGTKLNPDVDFSAWYRKGGVEGIKEDLSHKLNDCVMIDMTKGGQWTEENCSQFRGGVEAFVCQYDVVG